LAPSQAAPLICAGVTSYRGLKQTEARPGEWVAIQGFGHHGHLAVQYAKAMGLLVCAIDSDDTKLADALALGADLTVNPVHGDAAEAVRKGTGGGSHGVLITAFSPAAFAQGMKMTRKAGTCVIVGLPLESFPQPQLYLVINSITIRGSFAGDQYDIREALSFAVDGRVSAAVELQQLTTINETFRRIQRAEVSGHVVLQFGNT
jgi:propanol-preferring alcohol dehydrogenase